MKIKLFWLGFGKVELATSRAVQPQNEKSPLKRTEFGRAFPCSQYLGLTNQILQPQCFARTKRYRNFALSLGAIALLLVSCQAPIPPQGITVQVDRVVSGQTLEIFSADGQAGIERVRLIGIDAPDFKQQPWGSEAKGRLEELINGQPVLLESDVEQKNPYGQRLAYIWIDGVLLNQQLVKEGYALAVPRSPNTKYIELLARAQEWARLSGKGIWNPENPMRQTPTEFRDRNR